MLARIGRSPVEINAAVAGAVESMKIISLCHDITTRERNEETLRASEAKYIELVEGLPEMVLEVDTQGHVVFANSKVLEMTGYSKKELEHGFDANLLLAPQEIERSRENMKKMFTNGKRVAVFVKGNDHFRRRVAVRFIFN
jgi:PAS domain S-box-containing protein